MDPKKIKLLVTGGTGLVGSAIKKVLCDSKYKNDVDKININVNDIYNFDTMFVSSSDYNLEVFDEVVKLFKHFNPDFVIHLAANVGGLFKNMRSKVEMLESNLMINFNILKCCHIFRVKKLISCLSTCIFPDNSTELLTEDMLHKGPPHHSNDTYAYAKRMLEIHSKAYRDQYGDDFVCVIPSNIYGPCDNFDLENGHVIPSLIHKCYLAKQNGSQFVIGGTGEPLRQFIYSIDLAKIIIVLLISKKSCINNVIISSNSSDEISIKNVAENIAELFNYGENIVFDKSCPDGQYRKTSDNSKIKEIIGEFTFTPLQQGLSETIEWFVTNYNTCRGTQNKN
jgi:GDP-L-fucose synthase